VLDLLERHPHARSVLAPALADPGRASHAYLFHGPGGAGKRDAARALAAVLLSDGSDRPDDAGARTLAGVHPDLTWVAPSGAHEILVADIDGPVIAASTRTPFESSRRVFVIERADELGDEAANRMLKTLEEPPAFAHLVLITERLAEVLPTIRSRCQLVRFQAPALEAMAAELASAGVAEETARACAALALGDRDRARALALGEGPVLRSAGERLVRAALAGDAASERPWAGLLKAVRARGDAVQAEIEARAAAELELYPRKERKRMQTDYNERARRARRRTETAALDLALQMSALWLTDLAALGWGADDLMRNVDRREQLVADAGRSLPALTAALELVEDTRQRFQLNVTEELACEALAYRLERLLSP
jgi:DNA polymerase-3 subunit delta'